MPVWHASVARIARDRQSIKPRALWRPGEVAYARNVLVNTLAGVGNVDREWREDGELAVHVRRQLKPWEIDVLYELRPDAPVFTHGQAQPTPEETKS